MDGHSFKFQSHGSQCYPAPSRDEISISFRGESQLVSLQPPHFFRYQRSNQLDLNMFPTFVQSPILFPSNSVLKRPRNRAVSPIRAPRCCSDPTPKKESWRKPVRIALTREYGKNIMLRQSLEQLLPGREIVELPCVGTIPAKDRDQLPQELESNTFDWIVITSPEAASVFISGWREADYPTLGRIAAVGKATGDKLRAFGITVDFEPTKATGKTLVREFQQPQREGERVLYPASARASNDIAEGLSKLGFSVLRLNTYSTETRIFDSQELFLADAVDIVTFASPSGVRGWVKNMDVNKKLIVACIGETSAKAAISAGFERVHHPENPGLDGWVTTIGDAMKLCETLRVEAK